MTLTKTTDHDGEALEQLLEQFKQSDNLKALLSSYAPQVQEIEDMLWGLLELRWLDDAEGAQLDGLGQIVGQPRSGFSDDEYRLWLRARILLNLGSGEPETIILMTYLLTLPDAPGAIEISESQVATLKVKINSVLSTVTAEQLAAILGHAKVGGVRLLLYYVTSTDNPFVFYGGTGGGFGDEADPGVGGEFSGIVTA